MAIKIIRILLLTSFCFTFDLPFFLGFVRIASDILSDNQYNLQTAAQMIITYEELRNSHLKLVERET